MNPSNIIRSGLPWLRLDLPFDAAAMLSEVRALDSRFVTHRASTGRGWSSICLHGLGEGMTQSAKKYGYADDLNAPLDWTKAADECPAIRAFLQSIPVRRFHRVRIMKLAAAGYILPHSDTSCSKLEPINVALNQPPGCFLKMERHGIVPFEPGTAFLLDVSNRHAAVNLSDEDRYHLIIHSTFLDDGDTRWNSLISRSVMKYRKSLR